LTDRPRRRGQSRGEGRPRRERAVDLERYRSFIPEWPAFLEAANRPEPTVFRVRTGRVSEADLLARLGAQGFETRALEGQPGLHQVEREPRPVSMTLEHWNGLLYVQQASTGVAAPALDPEPGQRVLDLCAAPGGKTTHLADLMRDRGCLVAAEISESRIRGLLGNVYRLAHTNVLVVAADGRELPERALFDRVLVDAPCSGEGTLRRRAGSPPDQSSSFLGYVTRAQTALLEKAVRLTRPGGVILYVTCTFAPDENEAVVSDALERLPVELEPLDLAVPHARGLTTFDGVRFDSRLEGAARIYPHHFDSGGLFLCRLRRLEGEVAGSTAGAVDGWRPDADRGWSAAPWSFPDEGEAGARTGAAGAEPGQRDPDAEHEARTRILGALDEVRDRYGIARELDRLGWTDRGRRAWVHTAGEWPLDSWSPGRWRPISLGLRAIEFDGRGRPRPTNDFLRWAGGRTGLLDLDAERFRALLGRQAVPVSEERRGPIAIGMNGEVLGRAAVTGDGLKSEIPKARVRDLLRVLEGS
jgi:NOL1/NOP2/sun family putative RNA methylase